MYIILAFLFSIFIGIRIYKSFDNAANTLNAILKFFTAFEMVGSFFIIMYYTKFFWFSSYFNINHIDYQKFFACLVLAIVVSMNIYIASLFVIGLCNMMNDVKKIKEIIHDTK